MATLLEAILLPDKVAICKCAAHTNNKDFVSAGNARADAAAKAAATQQTKKTECTLLFESNPDVYFSLQSMQAFVYPDTFLPIMLKRCHGSWAHGPILALLCVCVCVQVSVCGCV